MPIAKFSISTTNANWIVCHSYIRIIQLKLMINIPNLILFAFKCLLPCFEYDSNNLKFSESVTP